MVEDGKLEGPRDLPLDQLQCQLANGHQRCGRSRAAAGGWRLLLLGPLLGWQRGGRHLWPAAAAGGGIRRSCCCCCRCCWRCCWRYSRAGMLGCCQGALGGDVARSAQEQRRGSSTGAGGGGGVCVGGGQSHVVQHHLLSLEQVCVCEGGVQTLACRVMVGVGTRGGRVDGGGRAWGRATLVVVGVIRHRAPCRCGPQCSYLCIAPSSAPPSTP